MPSSRLLFAPAALALLLACPQAQPTPTTVAKQSGPTADDPRVVADTGDLYAARSINPEADPATSAGSPTKTAPAVSLGTGKPDETNGVCRLYAPELRDPHCCEHTLGFDVKATTAACNLPIYLGESFHNSCGFYFVREANTPAVWLRLLTIQGATPKDAADEHVMLLRRTDPAVTAEPFPGIDGAWWVRQDDYRWAFIPGWKIVRLLAWRTGACSDEAVPELLKQLVAAPETVTGPRRQGLFPAAIPGPAPAPAAPSPAPASAG